ncbi:phosphoserine phosphatase SerB [Propylenella binzhouense]|nr:phosphoserine phosphatase SerB [Propylenella binzhouense]
MALVLTIIAAKAKAPLSGDLVDRVRAALGPAADAADWLSPGEACDIGVAGERATILDAARRALAGAPVDLAVLPAENRRKKLLLADMDSTLIGQECIDELADVVGVGSHVAAITERAMRGEIAFEPALRERVSLLAGLSRNVVERVLAERITLNPGGRTLVQTMRKAGAHTALVSGGFTVFTGPIAERLGFHVNRANTLILDGEIFTGHVAEPILGREAKEATLRELAAELGIGLADVIAVGDGANDLGMVRAAGLGVAYHAKPALRAEADAAIDHGDLSALLFLQGYRRDEFAA